MFTSVLAMLLSAAPAHAATFQVDPSHSMVGFSVSHMTFATVRGFFGTVSGTVSYDPANVAATRVDGTVAIDSVNTMNADRDAHLKKADFFDAARFPNMTFESTAVKNVGADGFDLVGELTLRGVTREVVFRVARPSAERTDPWGKTRIGTQATTVINRQDFGVSYNQNLDQGGLLVGDEVTITLDLELVKG